MRLHVAQQLRQAVGTVLTLDLHEDSVAVDDALLRGLTGSATLLRTDRGLLVSLRATATVDERCSRCLADASCSINIDFEEEYMPVIDAATGAPVRLPEPGDLFRIGPDFVLDLREGLRQYTLISEPAKPLCKPDCAGLCLNCGADLNEGPCRCPPQVDERWQALAGLRNTDKEGS